MIKAFFAINVKILFIYLRKNVLNFVHKAIIMILHKKFVLNVLILAVKYALIIPIPAKNVVKAKI